MGTRQMDEPIDALALIEHPQDLPRLPTCMERKGKVEQVIKAHLRHF